MTTEGEKEIILEEVSNEFEMIFNKITEERQKYQDKLKDIFK